MIRYTLKPRLAPIADSRHAEDDRCPDGGNNPLTRKQKSRLSILARKAFTHQQIQGVSPEDWRHDTAISACGFRISEASQKHWADLQSAFQDLAGEEGKAFRTQVRAGDNKRRVALHKLTTAITERGLHISYAESISMAQFKVPIAQASAKQIWCLFYTVTNRRKIQP